MHLLPLRHIQPLFLFLFLLLFPFSLSAQQHLAPRDLAGRYDFDNGMSIQFKAKDKTLFLITPGNPLQEMEPTAKNTYRSKVLGNEEFIFSKFRNDSIRVVVKTGGGSLTGRRVSKEVADYTEAMDTLLTLRKKSAHFEYWYSDTDAHLVDSLTNYLEDSYDRILKDFQLDELPVTRVKIYPDLKSFHMAINQPDAPAEVLATAFGKDEFRMVSPTKGGEDMMKFISHEFAHCVHLNIDYSPNNPRWLWEGVAMYESNWFMDPGGIDDIKNRKFPALNELSNGMEYMLGYVVIEAIKDLHGFDKVIELIKNRGDVQKVFGVADADFSANIFDHIHKKYVSNPK